MKNHECNIIQDILPLYAEHMVHEDTKEFVEAHLLTCADCKNELAALTSNIPIEEDVLRGDSSMNAIKKIKFDINKKRVFTAILASIISVIAAILFFAYLTAPEYISYSEDKDLVNINETDGIVTLSFTGQYELSDGLGIGTYYLSLYDTTLNRLLHSSAKQVITLNPNGEKVQTIYYVSNSPTEEDHVIYGLNPNPNGGTMTLPRLFFSYYFLIALLLAVILLILFFFFRKKQKTRARILKFFFAPVSYILSHLMILGGTSFSYSPLRDLSLILLLSIPTYFIIYVIYLKIWSKYGRIR